MALGALAFVTVYAFGLLLGLPLAVATLIVAASSSARRPTATTYVAIALAAATLLAVPLQLFVLGD